MEKIGGKTAGFGFGAGGALAYAKHATTDTMYLLGWNTLPPEPLEATRELLTGAWGVIIVVLFMWLGHMINRVAAAWGQSVDQQPEA